MRRMKHYAPIAILVLAAIGFACGESKPADSTASPATTAPAAPPANPQPGAPPPAMPAPQTPPGAPVRGRGPLGPVNNTAPGIRAVAAPDDSEVTAALARDLVKTRTFKSHPTIAKVEEITDGTNINHKTIKVYLKSGAVKEIPDGKIGDPMAAPAAKIVAAIEGK
jgi:hypothetical protein